nr:hypothetical protein [Tanacetum cinerariifolium]
MAASRSSNAIARRKVDELAEFSGETQVPKYAKFFILQQITEARRFLNFLCDEVQNARNVIAHLNGMIAKFEAMDDQMEAYDSLWCFKESIKEQGLKLIHTNNDVHSFFANAELNGKIHLYIAHKQQPLGRYYLRNMVWLEEDTALRCYSSSSFTTRIKKRGGKTSKEGLRKQTKPGMVDDEPVGRKSGQTSRKGKEIMYELPAATTTKEREVVVTNYKRAIVNGKAKMVEDVGPVQENVDVGIKKDVIRRTNVLGLMAPSNLKKKPMVSASMGQGSNVKDTVEFFKEENETNKKHDEWVVTKDRMKMKRMLYLTQLETSQ